MECRVVVQPAIWGGRKTASWPTCSGLCRRGELFVRLSNSGNSGDPFLLSTDQDFQRTNLLRSIDFTWRLGLRLESHGRTGPCPACAAFSVCRAKLRPLGQPEPANAAHQITGRISRVSRTHQLIAVSRRFGFKCVGDGHGLRHGRVRRTYQPA